MSGNSVFLVPGL
ncbi:hypothetical protein YPPY19_4626, partial [Yersinia pestis PY-19]